MSTEFIYNSIQIDQQNLQKHFPLLALMIRSSMPKKKRSYRKRKKKETVGPLIQDIIDGIEK